MGMINTQLITHNGRQKHIEKMKILWKFLGALILENCQERVIANQVTSVWSKSLCSAVEFAESHRADRIVEQSYFDLLDDFANIFSSLISVEDSICQGLENILDRLDNKLIQLISPTATSTLLRFLSATTELIRKLMVTPGDTGRVGTIVNIIRSRIIPAALNLWSGGYHLEKVSMLLATFVELELKFPGHKMETLHKAVRTCAKISPRWIMWFLARVALNCPSELLSVEEQNGIIALWYRCCLLDCRDSEDLRVLTNWIFAYKNIRLTLQMEDDSFSVAPFVDGRRAVREIFPCLFERLQTVACRKNGSTEELRRSLNLWFGDTSKIIHEISDNDKAKLISAHNPRL